MDGLKYHPDARNELRAEVQWYETCQFNLGRRFATCVSQTISKIQLNPTSYPFRKKDVRHCPVNDFPFWVIYVIRTGKIWIVAIAHQKRRPNYWADRLNDIP